MGGDGGGDDGGSEEESFEYTDDDEEDNQDDFEITIENAYYNAKGLKETDVGEAEEAFLGVIATEQEEMARQAGGDSPTTNNKKKYGPWSFKALKQLMKLHLQTNDPTKAMERYTELLVCVADGVVSPNAVEKGVNGMLERVSALLVQQGGGNGDDAGDADGDGDNNKALARNVYDATISVFHPQTGSSPNERLWFKTLLKFGQLLYEMKETAKLQMVIRDLLRGAGGDSAGGGTGEGATASGSTNLMEIMALQIQLYSRQKDNKKLREVFDKAMRVQGGIPHPRTLAIIQELGGKMHMQSREFEKAATTFFQAFKSYDEAGDRARLRCLKYLVLSSMLHASSINPFDSQEARPYRDDPEIQAMTNLVHAFQNNEIKKFESILRSSQGRTIKNDEFIAEYLSDLLRTIRTQVLIKVIGPYERISLKAIARELNGIPTEDVESLLVRAILDGRLNGRIDQVDGVLLKNPEAGPSSSAGGTSSSSGGAGTSGDGAGGIGSGAGAASGTPSSGGAPLGFGASAGAVAIEMRNYDAMDALSSALENLTAAVTGVSGMEKSSGLRLM
jgi:COP9 signalosome complex subunit 2